MRIIKVQDMEVSSDDLGRFLDNMESFDDALSDAKRLVALLEYQMQSNGEIETIDNAARRLIYMPVGVEARGGQVSAVLWHVETECGKMCLEVLERAAVAIECNPDGLLGYLQEAKSDCQEICFS